MRLKVGVLHLFERQAGSGSCSDSNPVAGRPGRVVGELLWGSCLAFFPPAEQAKPRSALNHLKTGTPVFLVPSFPLELTVNVNSKRAF